MIRDYLTFGLIVMCVALFTSCSTTQTGVVSKSEKNNKTQQQGSEFYKLLELELNDFTIYDLESFGDYMNQEYKDYETEEFYEIFYDSYYDKSFKPNSPPTLLQKNNELITYICFTDVSGDKISILIDNDDGTWNSKVQVH